MTCDVDGVIGKKVVGRGETNLAYADALIGLESGTGSGTGLTVTAVIIIGKAKFAYAGRG